MAIAAVALPLIAGAISAGGAVYSGIRQSQAANHAAKVAEMNRKIADENAVAAVQRGNIAAQDSDRRSDAAIGQLVSGQAASGLSLGGGSHSLARRTAANLARLDALRIGHAGQVEAAGYRAQSSNFRAQADASRAEASTLLTSGIIGGAGSLIGGAASINPSTFNRISGRTAPHRSPRGLIS